MIRSSSTRWELLLADLSLILFIVSLAGLATAETHANSQAGPPSPSDNDAPSQAIYRNVAGAPQLGEWLDSQMLDPRLTLTIRVEYSGASKAASLARAAAMAGEATRRGLPVHTVLVENAEESAIMAELAFDRSH
jgi:hypothetical protein